MKAVLFLSALGGDVHRCQAPTAALPCSWPAVATVTIAAGDVMTHRQACNTHTMAATKATLQFNGGMASELRRWLPELPARTHSAGRCTHTEEVDGVVTRCNLIVGHFEGHVMDLVRKSQP